MPELFRRNEYDESDPGLAALRHELRRAPAPQNKACLKLEYARNRVGVLFDAVCAPDSTGVPCPVDDCPFAVKWGERGEQLVGSCAVGSVIEEDR